MTVYILGAGASFHAGYPLAAEMGVALSKWLERAVGNQYCPLENIESYRALVLALRERYPKLGDFESIVTDWESGRVVFPCSHGRQALISAEWQPSNLRSAIADFFFQVPRVACLYRRLAEGRIKERDAVITFNYDVAFERELRQADLWSLGDGYGFPIFPESRRSPVVVLKLHGSVNWVQCLGPAGPSTGKPFDKPPAIMPQDLADLGYEDQPDAGFRPGGLDRPRLILPTKEKHFEPRLFDTLWSQAEDSLRRASELTVIGYSFPEADERAMQLVFDQTSREARVTICCRADGPRICGLFRSRGFASVTDADSFESWLAQHGSRVSQSAG